MSQKEATSLISLEDLFKGRTFMIPDYQRGYSWEGNQLIDLRKDVENLYDRDASHVHYTGTIVASSRNGGTGALEVVDGQQRLTSLVMLIKAIHHRDPAKYHALYAHYIERGGAGNQELVLKPNQETALFFRERVLDGQEGTPTRFKSHENIDAACRFFKEWLDEAPGRTEEILRIVTQRLGFIFFMPKHDKEIGIMFEVINNRGKELSQLEKMKNYFIYYATVKDRLRLHERINERWRELLENLSLAG